MGGKLCSLLHPKPQSTQTYNCGRSSSSSSSSCFMNGRRRRRNTQMEEEEENVMKARKKLTLEDWLLSSPSGVKPDYLKRGEICSFKNSRKKVHPSSSSSSALSCSASMQVHGRLISEAKDSLCLDRPMAMNDPKEEEEEGKSEYFSSVSIGKAEKKKKKKKVSFKLPHDVIMYSPEEAEIDNNNNNISSNEECFYSPLMEGNHKGGTFESHEEICFMLAVNTLHPVGNASDGVTSCEVIS